MKLSDREKIFLIIGLCVLIAAIYIQFIILPQSHILNDLKNKYSVEAMSYGDTKHTASLSEIESKINQINDKLENGTDEITQTVDIEHYIDNIDQKIKISGVKLKSIQFNINSQDGGGQANRSVQNSARSQNNLYKEYGITINIAGSYKSISQFLYFIQDSERLTSIKSITINRSGQTLEASINISIYYYSDVLNKTKSTVSAKHDDPFKSLGTNQNTSQSKTNAGSTQSAAKAKTQSAPGSH